MLLKDIEKGNCQWCVFFPTATTDAISSSNPRVIDDVRARKLSNDLKRCTYYETCATYGLNVERVFQDGKFHFISYTAFHKIP